MSQQGKTNLNYVYADGSETRAPLVEIPYVFSYQLVIEPGNTKQIAVYFPKHAQNEHIVRATENSRLADHVKQYITEKVSRRIPDQDDSLEELLVPVGNGAQKKGGSTQK